MAVEGVFQPEFEKDLADAYDWYERQEPGLGDQFLTCVEASVRAITHYPESCPKVYREFRRALVRRFPYAVFYEHSVGVVTFFGVFHTSRRPEAWKDRTE